ncbi:MAG: CcdB family protein [Sulfuricellaceae bacterium]|nr:CcdB family protein [Sulfuricellaceae bacterium]
MARFDIFRNSGPHADDVPYLLDVQSDLLHGYAGRHTPAPPASRKPAAFPAWLALLA